LVPFLANFGSASVWTAQARKAKKIRFTSSILPKWALRTKSLDALLPILYLRGASTGDSRRRSARCWAKMRRALLP
jgi:putative transposase